MYVTELIDFENEKFIDNNSTFYFQNFSSIKDKLSDYFIEQFIKEFGKNRSQSIRDADTVISLSSGVPQRGMTGHATYAAPVERSFSVGVCHRSKRGPMPAGGILPEGSITYGCTWKFYEVNNLCAAESEVIDFIIRNVKTKETSVVRPHSSTRQTVKYEIHPAI